MSDPIRLLLVDHLTLPRRCLAALLNRRRGLQVVGEAAIGGAALDLARSLRPDIALVEPETPDGGPRLIEALDAEMPGAVLVLTRSADGGLSNALRAGARGYLHMNCEPDDLVRAIERVHAGELVIAPGMADAALKELNSEPERDADATPLTERERDVLRLVTQGLTNAEIARELYITEHTTKGHLAKILSKLGLDNRVQIATYAVQNGFAPLPALEIQATEAVS
jgi:DNA-binding NarL/FixJ family response regulator